MNESSRSGGTVLEGLDRRRHLDLEGRGAGYVLRWLFVGALLALAVLALLNVFGQRSKTSTTTVRAASLELLSPPHLRTGLLFQTRITVRAYRAIKQPTIVLDRGWFEAMTFNGAVPDATDWSSSPDGKVELQYPKLDPGNTLVVWLSWQANPPNAAHRDETVSLHDGDVPLAHLRRTLTVFP